MNTAQPYLHKPFRWWRMSPAEFVKTRLLSKSLIQTRSGVKQEMCTQLSTPVTVKVTWEETYQVGTLFFPVDSLSFWSGLLHINSNWSTNQASDMIYWSFIETYLSSQNYDLFVIYCIKVYSFLHHRFMNACILLTYYNIMCLNMQLDRHGASGRGGRRLGDLFVLLPCNNQQ